MSTITTPTHGYAVRFGPMTYDAHRDGTPIGLAEAWTETRGVGQAVIYRPDGTVLLRNAGSLYERVAFMARRRASLCQRNLLAA